MLHSGEILQLDKSFRRIDSRYDRRACSFMGFVRIACNLILIRDVLR